MKRKSWNRREILKLLGWSLGAGAAAIASPVKTFAEKVVKTRALRLTGAGAPIEYVPDDHAWCMAIDVEKCIGCGLCAEACKKENNVPKEPFYFRTWIERYIIRKAPKGSGQPRGEVSVDSPNGGIGGFPPSDIPKEEVARAFFVPKLCNHCKDSPCTQSCPVGATFDAPDGVVLVDPNYCIGCAFCIQACPYGCRFLHPVTRTAEKCTLCYHRITRGLKTACVEVCPTHARIIGDLKNPVENDPVQNFIETKKLQTLKPHLRTHPQVLYAGLDKEVI